MAEQEADTLDTPEDEASDMDTPESLDTDEAGTDDSEAPDGTPSEVDDDAEATDDVDESVEGDEPETDESEVLLAGKYKTQEEYDQGHKELQALVGSPDQVEYRQYLQDRQQFEAYQQQQEQAAYQPPEPAWNPPVQFNEQIAQHLMAYDMAGQGNPETWNALPMEARANVEKYAGYVQQSESQRLHDPVGHFDKYQAPMVSEMINNALGGLMARVNATSFASENSDLVQNPEFASLVQEGMSPDRAKQFLELETFKRENARTTDDEQRLDDKKEELRKPLRRRRGRSKATVERSAKELGTMSFQEIAAETEAELAAT